ncbi:hypothetical protein ACIQ57_06260 [Lysinibacillus xylanilyticus]|uniref:hypothetical protein n=1 Tax=Lysinibacillus xylanilyticus TaxID=582475 RepID=UPI003806B729
MNNKLFGSTIFQFYRKAEAMDSRAEATDRINEVTDRTVESMVRTPFTKLHIVSHPNI